MDNKCPLREGGCDLDPGMSHKVWNIILENKGTGEVVNGTGRSVKLVKVYNS